MLPSGLNTSIFVHVPIVDEGTQPTQPKGFRLSNYVEPKALSIAVITLLVAFCYSSVLSYINFFAIEINLVQAASFFFLFYSTAILIITPYYGSFNGREGCKLYYVSRFSYFRYRVDPVKFSSYGYYFIISRGSDWSWIR